MIQRKAPRSGGFGENNVDHGGRPKDMVGAKEGT